jgi:hypothetical protein
MPMHIQKVGQLGAMAMDAGERVSRLSLEANRMSSFLSILSLSRPALFPCPYDEPRRDARTPPVDLFSSLP